jgi:hypothetical protein
MAGRIGRLQKAVCTLPQWKQFVPNGFKAA